MSSSDHPPGADESSLDQRIQGWVTKSGRALELRAARDCLAHGAVVRPSFPYKDPLTERVREGDIQAEWGWQHPIQESHMCSLFAIVECKSGAGKPWVAFYPPGRQRLDLDSLRNWVAFSWAPSTDITSHVVARWIGEPPFNDANPATHIVAANVGSRSARHDDTDNDKNEAWDAVRQVLAQTSGVQRRYVPRTPDGEERGIFVVAALVTAAPLFACRLNDDGTIRVEPVESLTVMGHGPDGERHRVHVMRESQLSGFAADLRRRQQDAAAAVPSAS